MEQMSTKVEDLSQPAREVVKWVCSRFEETAKWPSQRETIIFCRKRNIIYDEVIRDNHRAVEEYSRGNNDSEVVLAPWAIYDTSSYFRSVYNGAYDSLMKLFAQIVEEEGAPAKLTETKIAGATGVPQNEIYRQHIRWILEKSRFGVREESNGSPFAEIPVYYLRGKDPTLDEQFLSRPTRYAEENPATSIGSHAPELYQNRPPKMFKRTPWVFLASTYEDLKEYREGVRDEIARQKCLPLRMEDWSSDAGTSLERSLEELAQADLLIVVVGCRYGSPVANSEKSFTETEYETAKAWGLDVLAFLPSRDAKWSNEVMDPQNAEKLEAFKKRLKNGHISEYSSPAELRLWVHAALTRWKSLLQPASPQPGDLTTIPGLW
jgi:hypothetical protein